MSKEMARDMSAVNRIMRAESKGMKTKTVVLSVSLGIISLIFGGMNLARFSSTVNVQTIGVAAGYFGDGILYDMGCGRNIPERHGY